jgi:heat shock protein HslJ
MVQWTVAAVQRWFPLVVPALLAGTLSGCGSSEGAAMEDTRFRAVAGTDSSGDLDWIAAHPVTWTMTAAGAEHSVKVGSPCGGFEAAATVSDEEIIVDTSRMSIQAVYCEPPVGDYDRWLHSFIERSLAYTWNGATLTLANDRGSLTLKPDEGSS